jgi:four helix bundle protein
VLEIFILVRSFPPEEKYRLTDQVIRSSRSINAQIAERHGRRTFPDRIKFCTISRGSLSETLNHLIDAFDCKYISSLTLDEYRMKIIEVEKLLNGYISFLQKKNNEPK